jgi:hypothetical protein
VLLWVSVVDTGFTGEGLVKIGCFLYSRVDSVELRNAWLGSADSAGFTARSELVTARVLFRANTRESSAKLTY